MDEHTFFLSPHGRLLIISGSNVDLWKIQEHGSVREKICTTTGIVSAAISPKGNTIALGEADGTIRLRRVEDGSLVGTVRQDGDWVSSLFFSPDDRFLALGRNDGNIKLWEVKSNKLIWSLKGHRGKVWSISFSPEADILASGGQDGTIRLWRVVDGGLIGELKLGRRWEWRSRKVFGIRLPSLAPFSAAIRDLVFSQDGQFLAAGAEDGYIYLFRIEGRNKR